ncbi:DNA-directed RNA polymerase II subunit RPB3-like [Capsicum annuum]|uniref:DNA-directed RNA polymerase II subunit RPB3-like n=1 Tax=Capsicum annuum TaxID=4072 RepID=UPI001FB18457|nr:DNA-directed RNA polymerase II subunit RPB3-like [Capsicum annuum]
MDSVSYQRFPRIKISEVKPDFMKFELRDTDFSIANTLRRIMITEVPTIAVDLVEIKVNSSVLNDKFISYRLGLIPLTSNRAMSMRFSRDCDNCDGDGQFAYGTWRTSTTRYSYVAQSDFERFLENQKTQRATISKLEGSYSSLAQSHWDLRDSYNKMCKRKKKRDKSFTCIWKGVKGLWKVLKLRERIFSPREDTNDEDPTRWSEDDKPKFDDVDEQMESDSNT